MANEWDKNLTLKSRDIDGHELIDVKDTVTGLHQHNQDSGLTATQ